MFSLLKQAEQLLTSMLVIRRLGSSRPAQPIQMQTAALDSSDVRPSARAWQATQLHLPPPLLAWVMGQHAHSGTSSSSSCAAVAKYSASCWLLMGTAPTFAAFTGGAAAGGGRGRLAPGGP